MTLAIVLLNIYPRGMKTYAHIQTCTWIFIAAFFIINTKSRNNLIYPSTDKWIKCGIYPYSAILFSHKKERYTDTCYSATCLNLKTIRLCGKSQTHSHKSVTLSHLYEMSKMSNLSRKKRDHWLLGVGRGVGTEERLLLSVMFLSAIVMVAQLCDYKSHSAVHLKWLNCMVCPYTSLKFLEKQVPRRIKIMNW